MVGEVHIFKHMLYISTLEQARVLILGKYVLLGVTNTILSHLNDLRNVGDEYIMWIMSSLSQLKNML